jgi:uncharacterized protein (DUF58 family)
MSERATDAPARGAYCELEQLIRLRFLARRLDITRRTRALARMTGSNRSSARGRGIDFDEVRGYQPGDDIRAIDWRVTARTGDAHTKLFHEERERPVLLCVDQGSSLFFGSRNCFKSVYAAHVTALLAWSALEGAERIGALLFNDEGHREIRPRRSRKTVLAILSALCDFNHRLPANGTGEPRSLEPQLARLRRIARPGSSVFLVSDFAGGLGERGREHLHQLARHVEITVISVRDPLEQSLPERGRYTVTDGQRRVTLTTGDRALQERYARQVGTLFGELESECRKLGIPLLDGSTAGSPFRLLEQVYAGGRK